MILKQRTVPLVLLQLKALQRRLAKTHPAIKKMNEEIVRRETGLRGEQSLDYHLSFLKDESFIFLYDLCLKGRANKTVQIDVIAICPQYIAIIEVKSIAGQIQFTEHTNQMIRTYNRKVEAMPNPLTQVKRQRLQLADWFIDQNMPLRPIVEIVVFTNPTSIIETSQGPSNIYPRICLSEQLPFKLEQIQQTYSSNHISKKDMFHLAHQLKNNHINIMPPLLKRFQVTTPDIRSGVICLKCSIRSMTRKQGTWYCDNCDISTKEAHIQTLEDYYFLLKPTLTNLECRTFLNLHSPSITKSLLNELDLKRVDKNRYTYYELTYPIRRKG